MRRIFGKGARRLGLIFGGITVVGGSVLAAAQVVRANNPKDPAVVAASAWKGTVSKVVGSGLVSKTGGVDVPLAQGGAVAAGAHIVTDAHTRARIDMEDGSVLFVDASTDFSILPEARSVKIDAGDVVADVAHREGEQARVATANGEVKILGTKLAVGVGDGQTHVEVLRGDVELEDHAKKTAHVLAGERGILSALGVEVMPSSDLAQRMELSQRLGEAATRGEDGDAPPSGLGELRARRPGKTAEADHAVALESHAVKVRIVGNVARTEIDETFANDTDDVLEGIYRFPLPARAQIERLALEVDGALVDGSFVDRQKGAAIFRGAIRTATPQAPKPVEEVIWVPGPWRDPALLEWQRGGRFELKIFPIPKRGSRRVVLAYTETVAPVAGRRRYVYPLPLTASAPIGKFSIDAQVLGNDAAVPVRTHGYELERSGPAQGERLSRTIKDFVPTGDLEIEYALRDRQTDLTAWGYAAAAADPKGKSEGYVAFAMRPKLPRHAAPRPRDYVIVLDAGRSMFGERFRRASRLAVQITGEMDRDDRVTALACDLACKSMPGGLRLGGPNAAHDVDVFARDVVPEGATDLVGAVRSAARAWPKTPDRDLRVIVLSDGLAGAGYRRGSSVALEVGAALGDPHAEVIAVPIGADADTAMLADVARGGGGVLVPYAPGEALATVAIDVLGASFGRTLRDVEVTLPEGLADVAPATLAPIRAGSEIVVAARATGERVKGDVVVRGRLAGEPFEARYPVDVAVSTDAGNAFVPRLFAAARIADREREPSQATRAELVALSQRWRVPSRYTSLLVLESEAMFRAFGVDRTAAASTWTGESLASGTEVASAEAQQEAAREDLLGALASADGKGSSAMDMLGGARAQSAPAATATMGPMNAPAPAGEAKKEAAKRRPVDMEDELEARGRTRLPGRFMKRVWHRESSIAALGSLGAARSNASPVSDEKISAARASVAAAPDERSKTKELARLLSSAGRDSELGDVIDAWSRRDPLDADALSMRADLALRRGDRDGALRILGGVAQTLAAPDATTLSQLALAHERAGSDNAACAFRVAAAEVSGAIDAVARAVRCERDAGREASAARWMTSLADDAARARVEKSLGALATAREATSWGDVMIDATWSDGADVDVTVVDPSGARFSWSNLGKGVRVSDPRSRGHEALALTSWAPGSYSIELTRVSGDTQVGGPRATSGSVTVQSLGSKSTIPFVLRDTTTTVARVDVRLVSTLVAAERPEESALAPFDRAAAQRALGAVSVAGCRESAGPTGAGSILVTFAPTGRVLRARITDPVFAGSTVGACIVQTFRSASISSFRSTDGEPSLTQPFHIP